MEKIVAILDMGGFEVEKSVFVKTLESSKLVKLSPNRFYLVLGFVERICPRNRVTCDFVIKHIHHLSFETPSGTKTFQIKEGIVRDFYNRFETDENLCIGCKEEYKTGSFKSQQIRKKCKAKFD